MLRISPETATGLGLDTGERAALRSQLSMSGPQGKAGGYQALLDGLPELRRVDRSALAGRERAWLDTAIWLGDRVAETASIPYGNFSGYRSLVISRLTRSTIGSRTSRPPAKIETRADCEADVARCRPSPAREPEVEQFPGRCGAGRVPPAYISTRL